MEGRLSSFEPDRQYSPGEILADVLDELGMSQAELARRTGLSVKHINQISQGQAAVSADTAVLFEHVTGLDARVWSRLESLYRVQQGKDNEASRLAADLDWMKQFPVAELRRRGFISTGTRNVNQARELLAFFRVATPAAWNQVWAVPTAYRLSQAYDPNFAALASWIRIGELRVKEGADLPRFDRQKFQDALPEIRALTLVEDPAIFVPRLQQICLGAGVGLVIEPEVKGARINGIVRWLSSGNPLIMLSFRHRWADIFWFTFFHEAGHLLVHDRRRLTFVDAPGANKNSVSEAEADEFAGRVLIPREYESSLSGGLDREGIRALAERIGVHAGIVVGRLQHDGLIKFNQHNDLRARYAFE